MIRVLANQHDDKKQNGKHRVHFFVQREKGQLLGLEIIIHLDLFITRFITTRFWI